MEKRNSIKRKINALLQKTTENGASESESISAISKAKELMLEYFISEHELNNLLIIEKCTSMSTPLFKTSYEVKRLYPALCYLFDCKHFFNSESITFFGYEEDVQLCIYFYNFVMNSCFNEKTKYTKSEEYLKLNKQYHGRTLVSSYVKGFIYSISNKIVKIYDERKGTLNECHGIAVIEKVKKVAEQFKESNFKLETVKPMQLIVEREAFNRGSEAGRKVHITQGIGK